MRGTIFFQKIKQKNRLDRQSPETRMALERERERERERYSLKAKKNP